MGKSAILSKTVVPLFHHPFSIIHQTSYFIPLPSHPPKKAPLIFEKTPISSGISRKMPMKAKPPSKHHF